MRQSKPTDGSAGMAQGVDHLLRRFSGLAQDLTPGVAAVAPSSSGNGPIETSLLVASVDASVAMKRVADYVCDGTDDEEEINAAATTLADYAGGLVQLTKGGFYTGDSVEIGGGVALGGAGMAWGTYIEGGNLVCSSSWSYVSDLLVYCTEEGYEFAVDGGINANHSSLIRVGALMSAAGCDLYGAFSVGKDTSAIDCWVPSTNKGYGIYNFAYGPSRIIGCVVEGATSDANGSDVGIYVAHNGPSILLGNVIGSGCAVGIRVNGDGNIVVANVAPSGIDITSFADGTIVGLNSGTVTDAGTNTVGVVESPEPHGEVYVSSSAETTIATVSTPVKAAGTTTLGDASDFTMPSSNRLTYGGDTRTFEVTAALSLTAAADAKTWIVSLAKNGTVIASTEIGVTIPTGTNETPLTVRGLVELDDTDYVEVFIENTTDATNVTVERMTMTAVAA